MSYGAGSSFCFLTPYEGVGVIIGSVALVFFRIMHDSVHNG